MKIEYSLEEDLSSNLLVDNDNNNGGRLVNVTRAAKHARHTKRQAQKS